MIITGKKFSKPEMSRVKNGDIILQETKPDERKRLDLLMTERISKFNRSTIQNFIKSGYVTVDGKIVTRPNTEIVVATYKNGEKINLTPQISLNLPEKKRSELPKSQVIYEDNNVLVINKPTGLLSMAKGEYTEEPTLEDYGLLVHRLDRDTSGVVILAKNEGARSMLRKQFQDRKAHKVYYAIVEGTPKEKMAKIDLPITRNLKKPTTFMVDPKGKPAETIYKVLKVNSNSNLSLLELRPISGRTHQLRVHLRYIGCPILGDRIYGKAAAKTKKTGPNTTNKKAAAAQPSRLFLHAGSLEITIPGETSGKRVTFSAPLPSEFEKEMEK